MYLLEQVGSYDQLFSMIGWDLQVDDAVPEDLEIWSRCFKGVECAKDFDVCVEELDRRSAEEVLLAELPSFLHVHVASVIYALLRLYVRSYDGNI